MGVKREHNKKIGKDRKSKEGMDAKKGMIIEESKTMNK